MDYYFDYEDSCEQTEQQGLSLRDVYYLQGNRAPPCFRQAQLNNQVWCQAELPGSGTTIDPNISTRNERAFIRGQE